MKNRVWTALLILVALATSVVSQTFYGTENVEEFRAGRDKEFRDRVQSPLLSSDFAAFKGLSYFKTDEAFAVSARFTATPDESYFLMPTSTGISVKYKKVGELEFELDGTKYVLNAYQSERIFVNEVWNKKFGHAFFVPFRDQTNGDTTYSGGRYLYMKIPETEDTIVDFNLAFNPSCAYGSEKYTCPIPPRANSLTAPVKAGEKIFVYTKKEH